MDSVMSALWSLRVSDGSLSWTVQIVYGAGYADTELLTVFMDIEATVHSEFYADM